MTFMNAMKETMNEEFNVSYTENGALGYSTTGRALLDLNYAVASLRSVSEAEIVQKFIKAFAENPILAMRWLFFARDAREGLGERRLFRVIFKHLAHSNPEIVQPLIPLVAEFGRWDDLYCLVDTPLETNMFNYMKNKVYEDLEMINNDTGEVGKSNF